MTENRELIYSHSFALSVCALLCMLAISFLLAAFVWIF